MKVNFYKSFIQNLLIFEHNFDSSVTFQQNLTEYKVFRSLSSNGLYGHEEVGDPDEDELEDGVLVHPGEWSDRDGHSLRGVGVQLLVESHQLEFSLHHASLRADQFPLQWQQVWPGHVSMHCGADNLGGRR